MKKSAFYVTLDLIVDLTGELLAIKIADMFNFGNRTWNNRVEPQIVFIRVDTSITQILRGNNGGKCALVSTQRNKNRRSVFSRSGIDL